MHALSYCCIIALRLPSVLRLLHVLQLARLTFKRSETDDLRHGVLVTFAGCLLRLPCMAIQRI